jgi:hypothetical protein
MTDGLVRLASDSVEAVFDPSRGAEIRSIADRRTGHELLFLAPWEPASRDPAAAPLTADAWVSGYRGGWQELFPNAGNACEVDGRTYGFHGPSSVDAWAWDGTTFSYEHDGLRLERRPRLDGSTLRLEERLVNNASGPRPFVWVHHIAFGRGLLEPAVTIDAPVDVVEVLSEDEGELAAMTDRAVSWSEWSSLSLAEPAGRFGCARLREGGYIIRNEHRGLAVRVGWDLGVWPYVWYWAEVRATVDAPWAGRAEVLALEPASVPHSLGLAAALEDGKASLLESGESLTAAIEVTVLHPRDEGEERS